MARKSDRDLVYVEPSSVRALQRAAEEIASRGDGKDRKKRLNAALRQAVDPMRKDQQAAARGLNFGSNRSSARARRTAGVTKTGRARKGKGLRQEIAQTIRTTISTGRYAGVRVQQRSRDRSVNGIAKSINRRGYVRHPLFGDKGHWYNTTATNGVGWFYQPFERRGPAIVNDVKRVLDKELADLARDISRLS